MKIALAMVSRKGFAFSLESYIGSVFASTLLLLFRHIQHRRDFHFQGNLSDHLQLLSHNTGKSQSYRLSFPEL